MNKFILSTLVIATSALAVNSALADTNSLSVGYAQSKVQNFKNIRGVNVKYHYQDDSPVGIIASLSYLYGDTKFSDAVEEYGITYHDKLEAKYGSALVGPVYQVTDAFSVYALAGAGMLKATLKEHGIENNEPFSSKGSFRKTGFAWGAGVQMNPLENIVVDVGYEGSRIASTKINGFNVGVGYRF
ncbi:outer membrane beta-barrel protein [Salmonella enterica subsp. salamae]|nr:outer membrane beta-barrel protein [Salmonella enterica subsp. salamae]ECJ2280869.1 outer membrane beta-barrel protein [Salmonella enterica subsp. salamae]HCC0886764.1 Ail/Lom family outer membrane beta-barrel protein [Salmonella enterica]